MTLDQAVEIAKEVGPMLLAGVGAVFSLLFSIAMFAGKYAWKLHLKRMEGMASGLLALAEGVKAAEDEHSQEHKKVWDAIQGLRAELQMSNQRSDHLKAGMLTLEVALKSQVDRFDKFLGTLAVVNSRLDAVFKYVDAPKRQTD